MAVTDPYKVLGVSPEATDEEIKSAYRQLVKKYHPDNYADSPLADLANEKMQEINEAYDMVMKSRRSGASASASGSSYDGPNAGYSGGYSGNASYGGQSDPAEPTGGGGGAFGRHPRKPPGRGMVLLKRHHFLQTGMAGRCHEQLHHRLSHEPQ